MDYTYNGWDDIYKNHCCPHNSNCEIYQAAANSKSHKMPVFNGIKERNSPTPKKLMDDAEIMETMIVKLNRSNWNTYMSYDAKIIPDCHIDFAVMVITVNGTDTIDINELFNSIELDIGGANVDKISNNALKLLLKLYGLKYTIQESDNKKIVSIPLPFHLIYSNIWNLPRDTLNWHEVMFYVDIKDISNKVDVKILCNYVRRNDFGNKNKFEENIVKQIQYNLQDIKNYDKPNTFYICFDMPVHIIYFVLLDNKSMVIHDNCINEITLFFDNREVFRVTADFGLEYCVVSDLPGYYFINFSKSNPVENFDGVIDFSMINTCRLQINFKNEISRSATKIEIGGINSNIFRIEGGAGAIIYSQ